MANVETGGADEEEEEEVDDTGVSVLVLINNERFSYCSFYRRNG